jgi:hypothetical protein
MGSPRKPASGENVPNTSGGNRRIAPSMSFAPANKSVSTSIHKERDASHITNALISSNESITMSEYHARIRKRSERSPSLHRSQPFAPRSVMDDVSLAAPSFD